MYREGFQLLCSPASTRMASMSELQLPNSAVDTTNNMYANVKSVTTNVLTLPMAAQSKTKRAQYFEEQPPDTFGTLQDLLLCFEQQILEDKLQHIPQDRHSPKAALQSIVSLTPTTRFHKPFLNTRILYGILREFCNASNARGLPPSIM